MVDYLDVDLAPGGEVHSVLGKPIADAQAALRAWGEWEWRPSSPHSAGWWHIARSTSMIKMTVDERHLVDFVEVSTYRDHFVRTDRFTIRGIEVLARPADEVLANLRDVGLEARDVESGHVSEIAEAGVCLWRDGHPLDPASGFPTYFATLAIAVPGYWTHE